MKKICHLSTVHGRYDIRIFRKMLCSASRKGYDAYFVVADGKGDESVDGVSILDVGRAKGRLNRMLISVLKVFSQSISLKADVYHIHDPELLPVALLLALMGKSVVYDCHEDFPKQLLHKPYLNLFVAKVLALFFSLVERLVFSRVSAVVSATDAIRERHSNISAFTVTINNYPIRDELVCLDSSQSGRSGVAYVGGMSEIRGIVEIVDAVGMSGGKIQLSLAGGFSEPRARKKCAEREGWNKVNELGFLDRQSVSKLLSRSRCGIVTFLPVPNHIEAQPNKLFEYMSAGIPVIASHFPLWKKIVEGQGCGICVDPENPKEIAKAIDFLHENPLAAEEMGKRGKKAVEEIFNWGVEESKLFDLYERIS